MSIALILKIFSDCCVCFAILGAFPAAFPFSYPLLLPALACALVSGLAAALHAKGRPRLSRACALLCLPALAFAPSPAEAVIILPIVVYSAAVILRGLFRLEYYSYRQYFLRSLALVGALFLVLSAFSVLEGIGGGEERIIHAGITLRYGLVHLLCGVALQRRLRLGTDSRAHGSAAQMAAMLGGTGVVICGFLAAEPLLRRGAASVFQTVMSLLLSAVLGLLELFSSLLDQVELQQMREQVAEHREDTLPSYNLGIVADQIQQNTQTASEEPSLWWVVPVSLVLIAAMVLMLRSFRKKAAAPATEQTVSAVAPTPEKKQPRRSNRARVRQLYRDFLRQEKKRGLSLRGDYTSLDILGRVSADTDAEAAGKLREIYLRARYDENCEISRRQLDEAKAALKKSRGGANT